MISEYKSVLDDLDVGYMADILLDAEVRLGEILDDRPPKIRSSQGGTSKPLPSDISKRQSHQAQTLSKHPEIVEQAKAEAHEAALSDAQDMADILLDAEVRLGEILDNQTSRGGSMDGKRGSERTLPPDITHKQSHQAQTLSKHPEIVEQAKAEAHEAALSDAQDMADILLDAEIKLGELLSPLADPTAFRAGRRQLPECITHKESHYLQAIAKNQDISPRAEGQLQACIVKG